MLDTIDIAKEFENVVAGFSPRSGSDAERGLQPATTFICPRYFASVALTVYVSDARIRCASVSRRWASSKFDTPSSTFA